MRLYLSFRSLPLLFLACCLALQGCAAVKDTGPTLKTGMHIDAVLECAIEYPLLWTKDRRLTYGSKNGEIIWKPMKADDTVLMLISEQRETSDPEQQIARQLEAFKDLEVSLREEVSLPAGEAVHIIGDSTDKKIEIYQFSDAKRSFLLSLTILRKNVELYSGIMDTVVHSFQILNNR
jgi:hypothetical protein